jgi:hypothetical protein
MYACLLLPELIFLFKGIPMHFLLPDYPQLFLQLIALLCMFHVILLLDDTSKEQLIRTVFGICTGCFFILLYNPGLILSAAILALSSALYSTYYYNCEKRYNKQD